MGVLYRVTVAMLLANEFFKEENPSPVVKVNSNRKEDGVLSFHMELKDFGTQDRTLVDFSFNMENDAPEEIAKDMVSVVYHEPLTYLLRCCIVTDWSASLRLLEILPNATTHSTVLLMTVSVNFCTTLAGAMLT